MATTITIGPTNGVTQKFYVPYIGAANAPINATTLGGYSADNVVGIYGTSANRQGYIFNKPGAGLSSLTQFVAVALGALPNVYELNLKGQVTLDTTLFQVQGAASASVADTFRTDLTTDDGLVTETVQALLTARAKTLTLGSLPANVSLVECRLGAGVYGSVNSLLSSISSQPDSDFAANGQGSTIQLRITRTSTVAASISLTATY